MQGYRIAMDIRAPLVLFVYNRIDHLCKVIEALEMNYLARETELFVFSDESIDEYGRKRIRSVREYLRNYKNNSAFKSVVIEESPTHKGLAKSIIEGVGRIINEYGRVIVIEDDVIVSRDFLNFMNDCLDYYADNPLIWSITGVGYNLRSLKRYNHSVYLIDRMGSDCWAMWKDRWDCIDWDVKDYDFFKKSIIDKYRFAQSGFDKISMLREQMAGRIDSWAIRADYAQFRNNMMTVHPKNSFMESIGHDGSGTHYNDIDLFKWRMKESEFDYTLENVNPNRRLMRDYRFEYSIIRGTILKIMHKIGFMR